MIVSLAQIGNSKGVRIPKPMIEACGFKDAVNIEVKKGVLILSPVTDSKQEWKDWLEKNKNKLKGEWKW